MQCNERNVKPFTGTVGEFVLATEKIPGCGERLITAQVVADKGDSLDIVAQDESAAVTVQRADVQSYEAVYGTAIPSKDAKPIHIL